jgi:hypothetical protein
MTEPEPLRPTEPTTDVLHGRAPTGWRPAEGYLTVDEVCAEWPLVTDPAAVAEAHGVDVRVHEVDDTRVPAFNADDVRRTAVSLSTNPSLLRPEWRRDTPEGQRTLRRAYRDREIGRLTAALVPVLLVLVLAVGVALAVMLLSG